MSIFSFLGSQRAKTINKYLDVNGSLLVSVKTLHKLADRGDLEAQGLLSIMYKFGNPREGVEKNEAEALKWTRKLAERGMGRAQFEVAEAYAKGLGVPKDVAEAKKWYQRAAEQKDPHFSDSVSRAAAQAALAEMSGGGTDADTIKLYRKAAEADNDAALNWARQAAANGNAEAQIVVGRMYERRGDDVEANKWYRLSAEQGNTEAQTTLGRDYRLGFGAVPPDYAEALKWYRRAAENGCAEAQFSIGNMYAKGDGVTKDVAEAVKWYRKAAMQGYALAKEFLDDMHP